MKNVNYERKRIQTRWWGKFEYYSLLQGPLEQLRKWLMAPKFSQENKITQMTAEPGENLLLRQIARCCLKASLSAINEAASNGQPPT